MVFPRDGCARLEEGSAAAGGALRRPAYKPLEKLSEGARNTKCDGRHCGRFRFSGTMTVRTMPDARKTRVPECGIFTSKIRILSVNNDYVLPRLAGPVKGLFIAVPQIEPQLSDTARHFPQNAKHRGRNS
jgi:hypothetical protein